MRRDIQLIELFLGRYKDAGGNSYRVAERPDEIERATKAIDVIAVSECGLAAKLPKLVAAHADNRILLVEDASTILGRTVFSTEIDATRSDFPELGKIDSIWLAHTPVWESEKPVWFFHVWPNGVRERFTVGY